VDIHAKLGGIVKVESVLMECASHMCVIMIQTAIQMEHIPCIVARIVEDSAMIILVLISYHKLLIALRVLNVKQAIATIMNVNFYLMELPVTIVINASHNSVSGNQIIQVNTTMQHVKNIKMAGKLGVSILYSLYLE
jgi:hypothetical protein